MGYFSNNPAACCYCLCFYHLVLYNDISWRQDIRSAIENRLFKVMLRCLDLPYADGRNVHGLVRTCDIPDIHTDRDVSPVCKDQEDACYGGNFAAGDIVFNLNIFYTNVIIQIKSMRGTL